MSIEVKTSLRNSILPSVYWIRDLNMELGTAVKRVCSGNELSEKSNIGSDEPKAMKTCMEDVV